MSILRGNLGKFNALKVDLELEFRLQWQAWEKCLGQLQPLPFPHVPSEMLNDRFLKYAIRRMLALKECSL